MKQSSGVGIAADATTTTGPATAKPSDPRVAADRTRPARDLRGLWRSTLAFLVPIPMLALTAGLIVVPFAVGGELRQAIAGAAAHPGAAQAALWLSVIFALTVAPATMAVAWTGRRGAPWLTLAAGVSLLVAFGAGLPNTDLAAVTAAAQGLNPAPVTALDVATHPAAGVGTAIFLVGQTVGFVLLGTALWRARVLPAWLGIVLAASGP